MNEHFELVALAFFGDKPVMMNKKILSKFVEHLERWGYIIKPKQPDPRGIIKHYGSAITEKPAAPK